MLHLVHFLLHFGVQCLGHYICGFEPIFKNRVNKISIVERGRGYAHTVGAAG